MRVAVKEFLKDNAVPNLISATHEFVFVIAPIKLLLHLYTAIAPFKLLFVQIVF